MTTSDDEWLKLKWKIGVNKLAVEEQGKKSFFSKAVH